MAKGDELQKVGRAVAARRGELGMTQQGLADAAGVDIKTIYNLESGTRWPIARTRAAISAALGWEGDGLTAIAAGATSVRPIVRPAPALLEFGDEDLPDDEIPSQQMAAFQDYADEFKVRYARARRRYPGQRLSGDLVFPRNPLHAQLWDLLASLGWKAEAIPRSMAAMLVMRDEAAGGSESGTAAGLTAVRVT